MSQEDNSWPKTMSNQLLSFPAKETLTIATKLRDLSR
jgi:hypothetical protein